MCLLQLGRQVERQRAESAQSGRPLGPLSQVSGLPVTSNSLACSLEPSYAARLAGDRLSPALSGALRQPGSAQHGGVRLFADSVPCRPLPPSPPRS
jgi:hypothetical protein